MKRHAPDTVIGLVLVVLSAALLDQLFPPNLARYRATSTEVTARDGTLLRAFITSDGAWRLRTTPAEVEPRYISMLLAAEDRRFYRHLGVDPMALARAAGQWLRFGHIVSGGSTISMQVARLLEPHRRGIGGKLHDIVRAVQLERRYSKDEILGMYLTLAPFGGNLEGVRAASLAYFGREPGALTDAEAALLVALPQSPTRRRPDRHQDTALAARDHVLSRLASMGAIGPARAAEAAETPISAIRRPLPAETPQFAAGLARRAAPGAIIASTIDPGLQAELDNLVARETAGLDPHVGAAIVVVENCTRAIRAIFTGAGTDLDLTATRRSPGSALKPFIYGLAFDGMMLHPETVIDDAPVDIAGYAPRNFDREWHGAVTAREALQQSLNVPAIRILQRVGPDRFVARLRQAGAVLRLPRERTGLAVALGGLGINLRDLTMLYAALANGGAVAPLADDGQGERAPPRPFLGRLAAYYLRRILEQSPPPDGIVSPYLTAGRSIAFKTGTSYGFRDAWAVGYSGAYTVGVWVGRIEGSPRPGAFGRNTAAPLLFATFGALPPEDNPTPVRPREAIETAGTANLPAGLRRFDDRNPSRPHVVFPPAASTIDLLGDADGRLQPVILRALGGRGPLRWIVNGVPILPSGDGPPESADAIAWRPDGPGFVRVTVIDSDDRAGHSTFRLRPAGAD